VLQKAGFTLISKGLKFVGYWGKFVASSKFKNFKNHYINHFPGSFEIGRKDKLYWNYCEMKLKSHRLYNYVPDSYVLPRDGYLLDRDFDKCKHWIVKPCASARGQGILLITDKAEIPTKKPTICSKYIPNPLLINNRKFDFRIYGKCNLYSIGNFL
jgi:tubulin polyglutamylase TTLL4